MSSFQKPVQGGCMEETITQTDLKPILAQQCGNRIFAQVLNGIANKEALLNVLARYIHFNSSFGGGVANLAGEIAVRQDLFRDPHDPFSLTADRSVEIASKIFFAEIDEFYDQAASHRALAQQTLKKTGDFFGYDPSALESMVRINKTTHDAVAEVRTGYRINQSVDDYFLFCALGFHMASEILADEEFRLLDDFLRKKYPGLVHFLENTEIEMSGIARNAYHWIRIHTSVEADHFAFASIAANESLRYYAGRENHKRIKEWILEGFTTFTAMHARFMIRLGD